MQYTEPLTLGSNTRNVEPQDQCCPCDSLQQLQMGPSVIYRMSQPVYLAHTDTFLGIRDKMAKKQQTQPTLALSQITCDTKCQTDLYFVLATCSAIVTWFTHVHGKIHVKLIATP